MKNWLLAQRLGALTGIAVVVALIAVMAQRGDAAREREQAERIERVTEALKDMAPVKVAYYVTGSGSGADLTLSTPTGIEQISAGLPLMNKGGTEGLLFEFDRGSYVSISAQKKESYGEVTCRIVVDGETVSENTSTAAYGIASCSGRAD